MSQPLIVLKFGGSVLHSPRDIAIAVHEVYRWVRDGAKVIAVVSAIKGRTDDLFAQAAHFGPAPLESARALLAATGELASASLLSMALDRAGLATAVAPPWSIGLTAHGTSTDAQPVGLDRAAVRGLLAHHDAIVVPGFIALGDEPGLALLGRGGSDASALFLAAQLHADRCRLIKDVDGLYEWAPSSDPAAPPPRRFARLGWTEAAALGGKVIQSKAVALAQRRALPFELGTILSEEPTLIGDHAPTLDTPRPRPRPLSVALLGCGTVGLGVYDALRALPHLFRVVSVTVRDPDRAIDRGVDPALLQHDALLAASDPGADLVIEALGGIEPAHAAITAALARGARVVTANKAVVALGATDPLWSLAIAQQRLRYSATVGGAAPMLEAVARAVPPPPARLQRLDGILNGTCNYVLSLLEAGKTFEQAVRAAQQAGFAEADPSRDLDGRDAADKLSLLARAAWGVHLRPADIVRSPLSPGALAALRDSAREGEVVRQVASAAFTPRGVEGRVGPVLVSIDSPLGRTQAEWNNLLITHASGAITAVRGRGAGRHATTESVMADALDIARSPRTPSARELAPFSQPADDAPLAPHPTTVFT